MNATHTSKSARVGHPALAVHITETVDTAAAPALTQVRIRRDTRATTTTTEATIGSLVNADSGKFFVIPHE